METIKDTFRIYSLTLIIPLVLSIVNILFVGILGIESNHSFIYNFKVIWFDYYIGGTLFEVAAFKYHLMLLLTSFGISFFNLNLEI